MNSDDGIRNY